MSDSNKKGKKSKKDEEDKMGIIACISKEGFAKGVKLYVSNNIFAVIKKAVIAAVAIFVVFCVANTLGLFSNKEAKLTTIAESSLEHVDEIGELSTLKYTYNSYATVCDDKGNEKYYIAYEGNVKLGVDFSDIKPIVNMKEKKVIVTIPEIKVQEATVDIKSLDFIFVKKKYNEEEILNEAHTSCVKDLKEKIKNDHNLSNLAKENAGSTIRALMEPVIKEFDDEFTIEVK